MKTRRIEMAFIWSDNGSWNTSYVDIPADTPEDQLEEAGRKAALALVELEHRTLDDTPRPDALAGTFLYNTSDPALDGEDGEDDGDGNGKPVG